jgi:proline iminopeptidase
MNAKERFLAFRRSLPRAPRLEPQRVRVRGLSLAVFSTPPVPDATPMVCVNGGLLHDHHLLWPALSPLARRRQLIVYDQRGRGASEAPSDPDDARIEDDAADLGALRRALGLRQWDVLGHSWGGGIAMLGTEGDPSGIRRLVLVNAVGATDEWMPELRARARARLGEEDRAILDGVDDVALADPHPDVHGAHARAIYRAWFADPSLAELFTAPVAASRTGAAVAARLRRDGYDWRERVRAVRTPSLVIHGADDALPPSVAASLASLLPGSRLEVLPDAGHMPFWEAPEQFFALVEGFLSARTAG